MDYLCKSAEMLKLAERYDFLPDIFKLAVAIYEPSRDYEVTLKSQNYHLFRKKITTLKNFNLNLEIFYNFL